MDAQVTRDRSRRNFDAEAPAYSESHDGRFSALLYDELVATVNRGGWTSILDVGCGNAVILSRLASECTGGSKKRMCGVDLSPAMVEEARKGLSERAQIVVGDSEHLPWDGGSFDTVLCSCSFHHYPDPDASIAEMARVLVPGGRLVLADPSGPLLFRVLMNLTIQFSDHGDRHIYGKRELSGLLQRHGFRPVSWARQPNHSFILVAEKR